ncbi:hypothetical protein CEE36_06240 [candidate division TA06 bacterium B3_TA06]|uniref:Uncharacterized protein n=1 Tax=candidate division TA06 bacterium B3_TA06 TaxID=2012487 RepID=A0A532V6P1_UNCT6|nr:MAG: hypothetical protein CEE36_06240 [candidate division TA06 bacterium B3_TA06]
MRRYLSILPLLVMLACNPFDQQAAEERIKEIVESEIERLTPIELSLDLAIPEADSIMVDSLWIVTGIKLNTTFESESLAIYFNEKIKGDTIVTVGDSALVAVIRRYKGTLNYNLISREDGTEYAAGKELSSERIQWAQFADNGDWEMVGYSITGERSDTNTTRIFSVGIKGGELNTIIESSDSLITLEEFPKVVSGTKLSLNLRTVADTTLLVSFAIGSEAVRFVPIVNEAEHWDDRWETEVTLGDSPLVVGIIRKDALADSDYPADFNFWILPITE